MEPLRTKKFLLLYFGNLLTSVSYYKRCIFRKQETNYPKFRDFKADFYSSPGYLTPICFLMKSIIFMIFKVLS